jgi:hypothetical protein
MLRTVLRQSVRRAGVSATQRAVAVSSLQQMRLSNDKSPLKQFLKPLLESKNLDYFDARAKNLFGD